MAITAPIGADVEFYEPYTEGIPADNDEIKAKLQQELATLPVIKPYRIRINGVDVGLLSKADPPRINVPEDPGKDPLSITITLFPRTLTIKAE